MMIWELVIKNQSGEISLGVFPTPLDARRFLLDHPNREFITYESTLTQL
jgi:hypothetical protein